MYQDHLRIYVLKALHNILAHQARSIQSVARVCIRPYTIYKGYNDQDVSGPFWPICIKGLIYKALQVIGRDVSNPPWLKGIRPFIGK